MSALDEVLEAYRDIFGVKTERANETHRRACEEVAHLRGDPGTLLGKVIKEFGYGMARCGSARHDKARQA